MKILLGAWRSDSRKTLKTMHRYHCLTGQKKRRFAQIFGKLQVRYTRGFIYYSLGDFRYRTRYEVLGEDAESIVLRVHWEGLRKKVGDLLGPECEDLYKATLQHINFRHHHGRQYYWIGLGLGCEWFRKEDPAYSSRSR